MTRALLPILLVLLAVAACDDTPSHAAPPDPLPSWADSPARTAIVDFVTAVTMPGPDFVTPADRIAVFDNDGTLWSEQPMYTQLAFAIARVHELAHAHPEWNSEEPFRSILAGNLAIGGQHAVAALLGATHAGMTTDAYAAIVDHWIRTARHPTTGRLYTEMVYQPMLELLAYLRAHDFDIFIVSGGGADMMRPWTQRIYGVPPDHVIGSRAKLRYDHVDHKPVLTRLPAIDFIDDRAGKPIGIHHHIGRRPIAAFGNSDGDFEMLEWTTAARGRRLGVLVHHTDAAREWAYDRDSRVGRLSRALDEAPRRGWAVVDMKRDWRRVFPPGNAVEKRPSGTALDSTDNRR